MNCFSCFSSCHFPLNNSTLTLFIALFVIVVQLHRVLLVFLKLVDKFKKNKMQNDAGEYVDLYIPRKWYVFIVKE